MIEEMCVDMGESWNFTTKTHPLAIIKINNKGLFFRVGVRERNPFGQCFCIPVYPLHLKIIAQEKDSGFGWKI
jgi:hypothetical protein